MNRCGSTLARASAFTFHILLAWNDSRFAGSALQIRDAGQHRMCTYNDLGVGRAHN